MFLILHSTPPFKCLINELLRIEPKSEIERLSSALLSRPPAIFLAFSSLPQSLAILRPSLHFSVRLFIWHNILSAVCRISLSNSLTISSGPTNVIDACGSFLRMPPPIPSQQLNPRSSCKGAESVQLKNAGRWHHSHQPRERPIKRAGPHPRFRRIPISTFSQHIPWWFLHGLHERFSTHITSFDSLFYSHHWNRCIIITTTTTTTVTEAIARFHIQIRFFLSYNFEFRWIASVPCSAIFHPMLNSPFLPLKGYLTSFISRSVYLLTTISSIHCVSSKPLR